MKNDKEKIKCDKCLVRIPKSRQNLKCNLCRNIVHHRCHGLGKNDVLSILSIYGNNWSCPDCIADILPIGICEQSAREAAKNAFKHKCQACGCMSYKRANVEACHWCNGLVHKKCLNGYLGCIECCDKMIPGFRYNAADLLEIKPHINPKLFDPYNREDLINNIGNRIRVSEENSEIWNDISGKLTRYVRTLLHRRY